MTRPRTAPDPQKLYTALRARPGRVFASVAREALRRSREDAGNPPAIQLPDDCGIPDSCDLDADFGEAGNDGWGSD